MRRNAVTVVGAAETTKLGVIPDVSQIQLHADAALNALEDCGLRLKDIDGIATAGETPVQSRTIWGSRRPGSMGRRSAAAHS